MFFVLLVTLLSLTSYIIPSDAAVYVSTTGSDLNDGSSLQTAFATLGPALRSSDNTINIGAGNFSVPNIPINRTVSLIGMGRQLTFLMDRGFRLVNIGTVPNVTVKNVGYKFEYIQAAFVPAGTKMTFENVELDTCAIPNGNGLFQVDGGSLTFLNCFLHDISPNGAASIVYAPTGNLTILNSKFVNCPNVALVNEYFYTDSSIYSHNWGVVFARAGANMTIHNSEFFSNYYSPTINTFVCQDGARFEDILNNIFCGSNGNRFNCSAYQAPPLTYHDGCGRCGVTTNLDKDCNGICFGSTPAAKCRTPKTWYVAPKGNNTNDGTAFWKPLTIQAAVSQAQYKDVILAMPGNYTFTRQLPLSFQGKSITIRSYLNDPTTVVFNGLGDLYTPLLNATNGESFDSVLSAVTLTGGSPNVLTSFDSAVSLVNCMVTYGLAPRSGGFQLRNDGSVDVRNSIIQGNIGTVPAAGAMWIESEVYHYSYAFVNNTRFYFNVNDNTGTIRVISNSYVSVSNSWFDSNRAASASEISVDSPSSIVRLEAVSMRDTYTTTQGIPRGISCPSTDPLLQVTATQLYVCPNVTNFSNCTTSKVLVGSARPVADCGGCGPRAGPKDCLQQCWGYATTDVYGTCCNQMNKDCAGVCNGPAGYDFFWTCCQNKSAIDCTGLCNGTAKLDCFGVCQGDGLTDNLGVCCHDYEIMGCDMNCRSNKTFDALNVCCFPHEKDCAGLCYGNSTLDSQGTCCFSNEITGCDSVCRSNATVDPNGGCCSPVVQDCGGFCNGNRTDGPGGCCFDIRRDCNGLCNGRAKIDCDGNCTTPAANETGGCCDTVTDCFGNCEGEGIVDPNGVCCYSDEMDCMNYCPTEQGAMIHVEDHAGACCRPAALDCNSTCSGTAKTDPDGVCCEPPFDCHGKCGGTEALDVSGICCPRSTLDCAMQCNGNHTKDPVDGSCCMQSDLDCKGRCFGSNFSCRETVQIAGITAAGTVLTWMMALFLGALLLSL